MRWNRIPVVVLLLAAGLLFSSCVTVTVESKFEEDGSASHTYVATIDRQALEELGEMGEGVESETDFAASEQAAEEAGYEAELIDTEDELGIRLSKTVEDNSDLGQVLNELFTVASEDEEPTTAFIGSYDRDGNTHTASVTVDGDALFGDDFGDEEIPASMLSGIFDITYTVRMPGELQEEETNGRVLSDGRVEWDLPLSGTQTFTAVSETEGNASVLLWVLLGGLLLLFIGGATGLVVFLMMRNRKGPAVVPVAPSNSAPYTDPDAPTAQLPPSRDVTGDAPGDGF